MKSMRWIVYFIYRKFNRLVYYNYYLDANRKPFQTTLGKTIVIEYKMMHWVVDIVVYTCNSSIGKLKQYHQFKASLVYYVRLSKEGDRWIDR